MAPQETNTVMTENKSLLHNTKKRNNKTSFLLSKTAVELLENGAVQQAHKVKKGVLYEKTNMDNWSC
jgi:hypothetical protein